MKHEIFALGNTETADFYRECGAAYDGSTPFALAGKIWDAHCHIYPDGIAPRAVHAIDKFYEGIPVEPCDGTVDTLVRVGRKQGISKFVVHSVATSPSQVRRINEFLRDSMRDAGGAFLGMGTLFPDSPETEKDFAGLRELGLLGVKIHPDIQHFEADSPWAMRVYEMCEDADLPICVHTGDYRYDYSNPQRVANVLRTFPKLKFIGAHFGGWSMWEEAVRTLADFPQLIVDTSSSFFWLTPERAKEIIRIYGSERIMFGSDYPMWSRRPELVYLRSLGLGQDEYENICWRTCARVFDQKETENGGT